MERGSSRRVQLEGRSRGGSARRHCLAGRAAVPVGARGGRPAWTAAPAVPIAAGPPGDASLGMPLTHPGYDEPLVGLERHNRLLIPVPCRRR